MSGKEEVWQALRVGAQALAQSVSPDDTAAGEGPDPFEPLAERAREIAARSRQALLEARLAARAERALRHDRDTGWFLHGLLTNTSPSWRERHARLAGLGRAPAHVVIACPLGRAEQVESLGSAARRACLFRALDQVSSAMPGTIWGTVGGGVALVVPLPRDAVEVPARVATELESLEPLVESHARPAVAVGRAHAGIDGVEQSLREALVTIDIAPRLGRGGIVAYEDVLVAHLLIACPDLAREIAGTLDSLMREGAVLAEERLGILRAFLANACFHERTALVLGVPRKTLAYRLTRIERDLDLRIERHWCLLQLALLALDLHDLVPAEGTLQDEFEAHLSADFPRSSRASGAIVALAAIASPPRSRTGEVDSQLDAVVRVVRERLARVSSRTTVLRRGDTVMALITGNGEPTPEDIASLLREAFASLPALGARPIGGVARRGSGHGDRQALRVLDLLRDTATLPPVMSYDQALPYLLARAKPEIAAGIIESGVGRVLRVDKPSRELFDALAAYLEAGGRAMDAADALFIGRRTLQRRREKVERVTGRHIADVGDRLLLELGVRAVHLGLSTP